MKFKASFNTGFSPEIYECLSREDNLYHFVSKEGTTIKIRELSPTSLGFTRKTKELEISGILKLSEVTKIRVKVPEFANTITYDAYLQRVIFNYPEEISFKYQLLDKGKPLDDPLEIIITEEI